MKSDIAIKVENLSKCYTLRHPVKDEDGNGTNELWALKDVSFEIKKGESVGIIGPNGSGKSTLLKILAGVTKPTSGKVTIKGRVASILDIGSGFHPELSGRENVYLNGQIHGFSKKEIESKFDEIVTFSGIEKFIDEPVKNYSNGMYLRLAFSIMAHLDFDVYLFDEVLSVGDAEFQNKCIERITEITKHQKTVVVVYHNLIFADKIVNREIDIRTIQRHYQNVVLKRENEGMDYFDDEIVIENGILENIKIPCSAKKHTVKKAIIVIKSSMNLSLASSQLIEFEDANFSCIDVFDIEFRLSLASGSYILNLYDITGGSLILLHSTLVKVLNNRNNSFGIWNSEKASSVLLFDTKINTHRI